ncbi:MAG: PCRF domain-containing protein, partial [Bacilli bacterium]
MEKLLNRLETAKKRNDEINELLMQPEVATNIKQLKILGQEQSVLIPIVEAYESLLVADQAIVDATEMMHEDDEELVALASIELEEQKILKEKILKDIEILLIPKDPNDG